MPPIASLRTRIPAALLSGLEEEGSTPMPTEGMRGIAAICEQAGTVFGALARAAVSGGLGAVVAGNNASVPPPSQRISDMNNSGLASLGTLGALASAGSRTGSASGAAEEAENPAESSEESAEAEAPGVEESSDVSSTEDASEAPIAAEEADSPAEAAPVGTESEGASEVEEAPRRRRRAHREDAPRPEPAVVEAAEPEVEAEPVEDPALAEAHLPPPERDPFALPEISADDPVLREWLTAGAGDAPVEGGSHAVDPSLDPSVLP